MAKDIKMEQVVKVYEKNKKLAKKTYKHYCLDNEQLKHQYRMWTGFKVCAGLMYILLFLFVLFQHNSSTGNFTSDTASFIADCFFTFLIMGILLALLIFFIGKIFICINKLDIGILSLKPSAYGQVFFTRDRMAVNQKEENVRGRLLIAFHEIEKIEVFEYGIKIFACYNFVGTKTEVLSNADTVTGINLHTSKTRGVKYRVENKDEKQFVLLLNYYHDFDGLVKTLTDGQHARAGAERL